MFTPVSIGQSVVCLSIKNFALFSIPIKISTGSMLFGENIAFLKKTLSHTLLLSMCIVFFIKSCFHLKKSLT